MLAATTTQAAGGVLLAAPLVLPRPPPPPRRPPPFPPPLPPPPEPFWSGPAATVKRLLSKYTSTSAGPVEPMDGSLPEPPGARIGVRHKAPPPPLPKRWPLQPTLVGSATGASTLLHHLRLRHLSHRRRIPHTLLLPPSGPPPPPHRLPSKIAKAGNMPHRRINSMFLSANLVGKSDGAIARVVVVGSVLRSIRHCYPP